MQIKNFRAIAIFFVSFCLAAASAFADNAASANEPSRAAEKGCAWKFLASPKEVVSIYVQECTFGSRQISHTFEGNALVETFSDGGEGEKLIEFYSKDVKDSPSDALKKLFVSKLSPYEQKHCVPQHADAKRDLEKPFKDSTKSAWVIAPDKAYALRIRKQTPKGDMPNDSCGAYGQPVDSRSYFEFHSGSPARFAWVSAGQDTPLFDEQSVGF